MIKLILKFFPSYIDLAKIGHKTYYRFANSNRPWKVLDRKIKLKKNSIKYNIPEDSLMEGEIVLTGIDKKVSLRQCYKMAVDQLEFKSRKELNELWWEIKPVKKPSRWKLSWISLRHKDINNE